jgi:hypothetical protein
MNSKDPEKIRAHAKLKVLRCRYPVLSYYSGGAPACACCGEPTLEFLSLDHVEGGGAQHREETKTGGSSFYRLLVREGFPIRLSSSVLQLQPRHRFLWLLPTYFARSLLGAAGNVPTSCPRSPKNGVVWKRGVKLTSPLALAALHPTMHRDPSTLEVGHAALLSNALIGCQEVDRSPLKQPLGSRRRLPIRCSRLFTLHLLEPIFHSLLIDTLG